MYQSRFGLRRRPFPATPDCACYYAASGHERALGLLRKALEHNQGLAVLTGEPGTGKTLIAQYLLESIASSRVQAFLSNSHFADRTALLQAVLYDFAQPIDGSEQQLRLRFTEFLLQNCKEGRQALLVIDEAHHLSPDLLEELRLLGNLEAGESKALQIILVGQSGLLDSIKQPQLAAFQQRLETRATLTALGVEEAADYLLHHLRGAGARPEAIVSDEALELLARHTRGVPRLLNQAARQALTLADAADSSFVDAEAALEALAALGIEVGEEEENVPTVSLVGAGAVLSEDGLDACEEAESDAACRLYDVPRRML